MIDRVAGREAAVALIDRGRQRDAIRLLQKVLAAEPDDARAHALLAVAYGRAGDHPAALEAATTAVRLDPTSTVVLSSLAFVHARHGDYAAAEGPALDALSKAPDDAVIRAQVAHIQLGLGQPQAAFQTARAGLGDDPESADLRVMTALALYDLGRREEADALALEALALDPDNASAYNVRGAVALARRRGPAARAAFREALRLDPGNGYARRGLLDGLKLRSPFYRAARRPRGLLLLIGIIGTVALTLLPFPQGARAGEIIIAVTIVSLGLAERMALVQLLFDREERRLLEPAQRRESLVFGLAAALLFGALAWFGLAQNGAAGALGVAGFFGIFALTDGLDRAPGWLRRAELGAVALWYALAVLTAGAMVATGQNDFDSPAAGNAHLSPAVGLALAVGIFGLVLEATAFLLVAAALVAVQMVRDVVRGARRR